MQGPIKFRAWNKQANRFVNDGDLKHYAVTLDGKVINFDSSGYDYIEHFDVVRYTGLKDKNGVEIYEGDIWQYEDERGRRFGKVVFQHGMFVVHTNQLEGGRLETWNGHNMPHGEVIGNIYENPKLLESK